MELGFLTACLPDRSLKEIASWAADEGFEALEVAAWPALGQRPFTATHIAAENLGDEQAEAVRGLMSDKGLTISSLAFYDNNLHPDPAERTAINNHVLACIDAAARLGVPTVGTFVGRDWTKPVRENLREAEEVFKPLVDQAGEKGVKLVIENCVMEGWHPDGYPGNLAYSPELWEWMFSLGLYLNFDPSHLVWMGIDPVTAMTPYVDRIAHAQAKDIQLFRRSATATDGPASPSTGKTRGTSAGGDTESPALARWTGAESSTRSTNTGSTVFSPWNTKTRSGEAPNRRSRQDCGSHTAHFDH